MKLPIKLGWSSGGEPIRIDKLPPLEGEHAIHIHESEGWDKAHLKLEYGDTPYCLSLFIFDLKAFLNNKKVLVRSYDLWPKEIMFQVRLPNGALHPRSNSRVYRDDAVILDWGRYRLVNGVIKIDLKLNKKSLKYKIVFLRIKRYVSPKYGYSVRSEYIFLPI